MMKAWQVLLVSVIIICTLFALPAASEDPCDAYENWQSITEKAGSHVIMFGEMHGTNESPEAIRGVLCELVSAGVPIRFGVEAERTQSQALNDILSREYEPVDMQAAAPEMWNTHDGRSSQAVYNLLADISEWRRAGAEIEVFAFDFITMDAADQKLGRSSVMAREVDIAARDFDGAVLLFAGGYHVVLNPTNSPQKGGSLASEVTTRPVLALQMAYDGGEAYVTYSKNGSDTVTGIMNLPSRLPEGSPVRTFDLTPTDYNSGRYYTGTMSASPPAFPSK